MKKILIALFLLLTTTSCYAINETQKITLQEAIDVALKTNPQIKILKLNTESSINDIYIADKLQNPTIGAYNNIGDTGKGEPQQLGASYTIELFKRGKRKKLAQSDSIVALDNQKFQEFNLILDVKKAYFDVLQKKSNLKILTEQKILAKELYETTQKEYKNKKIPQTDVVQAKISLNRSIMAYNKAKSEVVFALNRFNTVMNTSDIDYDTQEEKLNGDFDSLLTLSPEEDFLTYEKIKEYALNNRYDLLSAQHEVQSAKENLKVAKSQLIPDVELIGGYAYQTKGMSSTGSHLSGAFAGINLTNIPLIYHFKPEIKNAKIKIQQAELRFEDKKIDITRNITDAWEKYSIAKDNINFYNKELLSNSKELLDASIKSLNKKEIDITTFLVTKKTYFELLLDYEEALAEYYRSFAELLKEMNSLMVEHI